MTVKSAFAHLVGQPPFFKINDIYSDFYQVSSLSVDSPDFDLPQDKAPALYYVGDSINFEIDTQKLKDVVPEEIIKKTVFLWEYGDGEKAKGLENTHSFSKMGSFMLKIFADTSAFEKNTPPQLLQSVMLHVLPDKNYQLPDPVITINGQTQYKDPQTGVLKNDFQLNIKRPIIFGVNFPKTPSSPIVSYFWDMADGETKNQSSFTYTYSGSLNMVFPALRVKDKNGFIVDTAVGISHNPAANNIATTAQQTKKSSKAPLLPIVGVLGIAFLGFVFFIVRQVRKA